MLRRSLRSHGLHAGEIGVIERVLQRRNIAMISRICAACVVMSFAMAASSAAKAQDYGYVAGGCGGMMKGFDGRFYPCEPTRKPVCQQSTGRCVCLLKKECGAKRDEGWYN